MLHRERGDREGLERVAKFVGRTETADAQVRDFGLVGQAVVAQARGQHGEALEIALRLLPQSDPTSRAYAYRQALEAAWALEAEDEVKRILTGIEALPRVVVPPSLGADANRYAGLLAGRRGNPAAGIEHLDAALQALREVGYPYEAARVLLERGELLLAMGRSEEAAPDIRGARAIFAELGASPMLERVQQVAGSGHGRDESKVVSPG
jgi:tetratricopeptide (TPR) repeat protein